MIGTATVLEWFHDLDSSTRIEVVCGQLTKCSGMELRFFGTFLENVAQISYNERMKDFEMKAQELKELQRLTDLLNAGSRSQLTLYLCLLRAHHCQHHPQNVIFNTIMSLQHILASCSPIDMATVCDLRLLLTLAIYHPVFTINQNQELINLMEQFKTLYKPPHEEKIANRTDAECQTDVTHSERQNSDSSQIKISSTTAGSKSNPPGLIESLFVLSKERIKNDSWFTIQVCTRDEQIFTLKKPWLEIRNLPTMLLRSFPEDSRAKKAERHLPLLQTHDDQEKIVKNYLRDLCSMPREYLDSEPVLNFFHLSLPTTRCTAQRNAQTAQRNQQQTTQHKTQRKTQRTASTSSTNQTPVSPRRLDVSAHPIRSQSLSSIPVDEMAPNIGGSHSIHTYLPTEHQYNTSNKENTTKFIHEVNSQKSKVKPQHVTVSCSSVPSLSNSTNIRSGSALSTPLTPLLLSTHHNVVESLTKAHTNDGMSRRNGTVSPTEHRVNKSTETRQSTTLQSPTGHDVMPVSPKSNHSPDPIYQFLKKIRLHKYYNSLYGLTMSQMMDMSVESFKERGLQDGAANKIFEQLSNLKLRGYEPDTNEIKQNSRLHIPPSTNQIPDTSSPRPQNNLYSNQKTDSSSSDISSPRSSPKFSIKTEKPFSRRKSKRGMDPPSSHGIPLRTQIIENSYITNSEYSTIEGRTITPYNAHPAYSIPPPTHTLPTSLPPTHPGIQPLNLQHTVQPTIQPNVQHSIQHNVQHNLQHDIQPNLQRNASSTQRNSPLSLNIVPTSVASLVSPGQSTNSMKNRPNEMNGLLKKAAIEEQREPIKQEDRKSHTIISQSQQSINLDRPSLTLDVNTKGADNYNEIIRAPPMDLNQPINSRYSNEMSFIIHEGEKIYPPLIYLNAGGQPCSCVNCSINVTPYHPANINQRGGTTPQHAQNGYTYQSFPHQGLVPTTNSLMNSGLPNMTRGNAPGDLSSVIYRPVYYPYSMYSVGYATGGLNSKKRTCCSCGGSGHTHVDCAEIPDPNSTGSQSYKLEYKPADKPI